LEHRPASVAPTLPAPGGVPTARVARVAVAAPAVHASAPESHAAVNESSGSGIETCSKHPGNMAAANCFVCAKPICPKCMEQFGYLCSTYCKGQAEARKMKVPVYAGQIFQKKGAEARSHMMLVAAGAAVVALMLGAYVWYWFVGSRPKQAFRIETMASVPFLHADWISDDQFFAVTPARVALFNSKDGSEVWTIDLPKGEINTSKYKSDVRGGDDDWDYDFKPIVRLVSKDIWIGLPTRVLRVDGQTGKKKAELILPQRASDYRQSETHLLAVSRNETNDSKLLTRINLNDARMDSVATPASSGARRVVPTVRPMQNLANTSLKNFTPEDEEFSEFNSISYGRDADFIFTAPNVAHFTRKLVGTAHCCRGHGKEESRHADHRQRKCPRLARHRRG
jgi:hypothetical protein